MANVAGQNRPVVSPSGIENASTVLERHAGVLFEAASKVLITLCGRPVTLTVDQITPGSLSTLPSLLAGPWIGMAMQITQAMSGVQVMVWKEADAVAIAQLILGEEPTSESGMSADYLDALSEATNQIGGAFGTALRATLGKPVALKADVLSIQTDVGGWHGVFREETPLPLFCLANVMLHDVGPRKVMLVVSSSLLQETGSAEINNNMSVTKEGTVSATSASAQVPFVPLAREERTTSSNGIDMLLDVNLQVSVELGRTRLQIRDILQLGPGSIVELDKQAGEAVDIIVNDKPIAKGEVIIIDENFGVRLTNISSVTDRIKNLR